MISASYRKMKHRVESMRKHLRGKLLLGEPMSKHTTLGIGGPADAFFVPVDKGDLIHCLKLCRDIKVPYMVIGNGSNILVRDGGLRGVVISTAMLRSLEVLEHPSKSGEVDLLAGSGILMSRLLNFCVGEALTGLEFTTGIPGTVGGAVGMNAGAYGSCLGDVLAWVDLVDDEGVDHRIKKEEIDLGYRKCRMPMKGVIVAAAFHLKRTEEVNVLDRIKELLRQRGEKMPFGWMNAGSIFKNPEGDYAGRIIEELGFKGRRIGDAMVSERHANVIVNVGEAKARDVLHLMEEINSRYRDKTGRELEPEIKIVGEG